MRTAVAARVGQLGHLHTCEERSTAWFACTSAAGSSAQSAQKRTTGAGFWLSHTRHQAPGLTQHTHDLVACERQVGAGQTGQNRPAHASCIAEQQGRKAAIPQQSTKAFPAACATLPRTVGGQTNHQAHAADDQNPDGHVRAGVDAGALPRSVDASHGTARTVGEAGRWHVRLVQDGRDEQLHSRLWSPQSVLAGCWRLTRQRLPHRWSRGRTSCT